MEALDPGIVEPVTDVCARGDTVIVSAYDRTLRVYAGQRLQRQATLPDIVYKICSSGEHIVCGSQNGTVYVLDDTLALVGSLALFPNISVILPCGDSVLAGSWGKMLGLISRSACADACDGENSVNTGCGAKDGQADPKMGSAPYKKELVRVSRYCVTAAAVCGERIAVAFEKVLKIYDLSLVERLSKTMPCNINAIALTEQGMYVGLISGRIHFEHFTDSDESFIFNAHTEVQGGERVLHSVNSLYFGDFLYSAGSNGRIYRWDVAGRKCAGSVFSCGSNIRKFLIHEGWIYAILEDVLDSKSVGRVVCTRLGE